MKDGGAKYSSRDECSNRARDRRVSPVPRRRPLGGMLHRAPNGDLVTVQTTSIAYPSPSMLQQLWESVTQRRAPSSWDGIEPAGALVVWWAEPAATVNCGNCRRPIGVFRSYQAGNETGIVSVDTRHTRMTANRQTPSRDPRFTLDGESGYHARHTFAHFDCPRCHHHYNRRLDRLGKVLWDTRPETYTLIP
jgi:hypothetical protein